ncbi:MAG: hypothetical protein DRO73_07925 [Candidatus Thorarchaeota archaeon]|nr:MAG: hypothetical protein DRO73_07925 [Candidatus Thorarchaeota archaeon]
MSRLVLSLTEVWPERVEEIQAVAEEAGVLQRDLGAVPGTIAWDLACFRVEQILMTQLHLPPCDMEAWESLWASTTKMRMWGSGLAYRPPYVYLTLLKFPDAFSSLSEMYKRHLHESGENVREAFLRDFFDFCAKKTPRLSAGQMRVFRFVLENQTVSPNAVAESLGTTKGYASRIVNDLKRRSVIWEIARVSLPAIGLKTVVLVADLDSPTTPMPLALQHPCPWLYNLFRTRTGDSFLVANFIVPASWQAEINGRHFVESIAHSSGVSRVRVSDRVESYCYNHYNYSGFDGREWAPYEQMSEDFRSCFKQSNNPVNYTIPAPDLEEFELEKSHMDIISAFVNDRVMSVRGLRKRLKRDYNYVLETLSDLRARDILGTRIVPTPLFASGMIIMVVPVDEDRYTRLCNTFSYLPEVYAQRTDDGWGVFMLRTPERYTRRYFDDIRALMMYDDMLLSYHGNMHFFGWKMPVDRWDPATKEWVVRDDDFVKA